MSAAYFVYEVGERLLSKSARKREIKEEFASFSCLLYLLYKRERERDY